MSPIGIVVCAMLMMARGETYKHIDHGDGTHTIIVVPSERETEGGK